MNKKIRIKGKVQGVFFRKSAQEKARELDIKGWVRNEPDGAVLTEIEGESDAVTAMESWLKQGPPRAQVTAFTEESGEEKGYEDFLILY